MALDTVFSALLWDTCETPYTHGYLQRGSMGTFMGFDSWHEHLQKTDQAMGALNRSLSTARRSLSANVGLARPILFWDD